MENPIKMDDLGVSHIFGLTPICLSTEKLYVFHIFSQVQPLHLHHCKGVNLSRSESSDISLPLDLDVFKAFTLGVKL